VTLVIIVIAVFAVPAVASAQQVSPTDSQYDSTLTQVGGGAEDPTGPSDTATGRVVDDLPFTGLDVALLLAVAALVGGSGLILRRATRSAGEEG
jgi:hypothetical protein